MSSKKYEEIIDISPPVNNVKSERNDRRLSSCGIEAEKNSEASDSSSGDARNAWVRLLAYCLACLCTSCLYFGWQDYSRMLLRSGAYEWECPPGSYPKSFHDPASCDAQSRAVDRIYAYANGSEFAFAAVAGVFLDSLGPRLCGCIGEALHMISIFILTFSSKKAPLYPLGLLIAGASVNIISFPALTVIEQWPKNQSLMLALIVGCQSSASVIAPILNFIWSLHQNFTYTGIWMGWLVCAWLPIASFYIWALPRHRKFEALTQSARSSISVKPPAEIIAVEENHIHHQELGKSQTDFDQEEQVRQAGHGKSPITPRLMWKLYFRDAIRIDMVIMAIYLFLLMALYAYYPAVVKDAVGDDVSDLLGWLTPFQGPLSVIIGYVIDLVGYIPLMYFMTGTIFIVNVSCALVPKNKVYMKILGALFVTSQSATYNIKYNFVNDLFDPYNFGKLVGTLGVAGGIGIYCSSPIAGISDYKKWFLILSGVCIFMALCATYTWVRVCKQHVSYKTFKH